MKRELGGDKTETLCLNNYFKDFGYKGKFKNKARLETEGVHFRRQEVTKTLIVLETQHTVSFSRNSPKLHFFNIPVVLVDSVYLKNML